MTEPFEFDPEFVPDPDRVIARYEAWWNNDCLDRPLVHLTCRRDRPAAPLLPLPELGEDHVRRHVAADFRIARTENYLRQTRFFGDTIPSVSPGLNVAYTAVLAGATVNYTNSDWIVPTVEDWDTAPEPRFDPEEPLMSRLIGTARALAENARGRYILASPPYVDCVTIMSQTRGTQEFCLDLIDAPEKVQRYRDRFVRAWLDSAGWWRSFARRLGYPGTTNWAGTFSPDYYDQIQCDFCVMIGPDTFRWLVMPEMRAEAEFFGGVMYHLDGPGEVQHLNALLEIPHIKAIQWVPIAGSERPTSGHWLPLLKRIQDAGKALQIYAMADEVDLYRQHLKPEGLMLHFGFTNPGLSQDDCEALMRQIERWR